ncbi:hypothetical protein MTO96_039467 [Rhipicephalus appendiculatus]
MPEVEMVDGEDISHEGANAPVWQTALSKNKLSSRQQEGISTQSVGTAGRRMAAAQDVVRRLAAASTLLRLPRSHIRVIFRPKEGLDLKKVSLISLAQALATAAKLSPDETKEDIVCPNITQNILVNSTTECKNAGAYAALCLIGLGSTEYQASAYMAACDDSCKGVIRGVDVDIDEQQLAVMVINQRNLKAMEVHRIKETTTLVIIFNGAKVPNYVMCGTSMLRCSLYKIRLTFVIGAEPLAIVPMFSPPPRSKCAVGVLSTTQRSISNAKQKCALGGGRHI